MTAPDPTTDDVTAIASHLAMSYGSHVSPPEGGSDWRAAESLMPWLAERDARVRAEALREAADWLRDDMDEPWGMRAANRLDARADRIGAEP